MALQDKKFKENVVILATTKSQLEVTMRNLETTQSQLSETLVQVKQEQEKNVQERLVSGVSGASESKLHILASSLVKSLDSSVNDISKLHSGIDEIVCRVNNVTNNIRTDVGGMRDHTMKVFDETNLFKSNLSASLDRITAELSDSSKCGMTVVSSGINEIKEGIAQIVDDVLAKSVRDGIAGLNSHKASHSILVGDATSLVFPPRLMGFSSSRLVVRLKEDWII
jgi:hypothetical protein